MTDAPYRILPGPIERVVIRHPFIIHARIIIGLRVEPQDLSFIIIFILCMIGLACVAKLTCTHVAYSIEKKELIIYRCQCQSSSIMVIALRNAVAERHRGCQLLCLLVILIPDHSSKEATASIIDCATAAFFVRTFIPVNIDQIHEGLPG